MRLLSWKAKHQDKADAEKLKAAIEVALRWMDSAGPPRSTYGHVAEDCTVVHIDHFGGLEGAVAHLIGVLSEVTGEEPPDLHKRLIGETRACDCPSCIGDEAAAKAEQVARERIAESLSPELRALVIRGRLRDEMEEVLDEVERSPETSWAFSLWDRLFPGEDFHAEGPDGGERGR